MKECVKKKKICLIVKAYTNFNVCFWTGSSHSDKEVDTITPEKTNMMRSIPIPGGALVAPSGAAPTIAMPERKRKRKG